MGKQPGILHNNYFNAIVLVIIHPGIFTDDFVDKDHSDVFNMANECKGVIDVDSFLILSWSCAQEKEPSYLDNHNMIYDVTVYLQLV